YVIDCITFSQLIFASAVCVFYTDLLPGITCPSDPYQLVGQSWGAIEIVWSTGLCGIIFSIFASKLAQSWGVTGPFSVLAQDVYDL
ncbi:hypothetical protein DOTSEDRAFT_117421, partial [Dothistroma septosporum NZE10]